MNATEHAQTYSIRVEGLVGGRLVPDGQITVDAASSRWVPVRVQAQSGISAGSHPIAFSITSQASTSAPLEEVIEKVIGDEKLASEIAGENVQVALLNQAICYS